MFRLLPADWAAGRFERAESPRVGSALHSRCRLIPVELRASALVSLQRRAASLPGSLVGGLVENRSAYRLPASAEVEYRCRCLPHLARSWLADPETGAPAEAYPKAGIGPGGGGGA